MIKEVRIRRSCRHNKRTNLSIYSVSYESTNLMLLEQDVGISQVFDVLISALQLLLQLAEPLLHIRQALVEKLRAVGIKQQSGFLLGGGLQLFPQLVEFGQTLLNDGLKLGLGFHERLTLLYSKKTQREEEISTDL